MTVEKRTQTCEENFRSYFDVLYRTSGRLRKIGNISNMVEFSLQLGSEGRDTL